MLALQHLCSLETLFLTKQLVLRETLEEEESYLGFCGCLGWLAFLLYRKERDPWGQKSCKEESRMARFHQAETVFCEVMWLSSHSKLPWVTGWNVQGYQLV